MNMNFMDVNTSYCQSITLIHFHQAAMGGSEQLAGTLVFICVLHAHPHRYSHSFYTIIFPLSKYQPVNAEVISEVAKCTPPAAA